MIEFEEVSKTYGRPGRVPAALEDVSFRVEDGEFALLMGPSGAGKSTLARTLEDRLEIITRIELDHFYRPQAEQKAGADPIDIPRLLERPRHPTKSPDEDGSEVAAQHLLAWMFS